MAKFTPAAENEAVRRYKAGEGLREIAAALGVTKPAVRYRLIKLGVQMRPADGTSSRGRNRRRTR